MVSALNDIKPGTQNFLCQKVTNFSNFQKANQFIKELSGINSFFQNQSELASLTEIIASTEHHIRNTEFKREYGDFQTPPELTNSVCSFLKQQEVEPTFLIEPTFGTGSFILSALKSFCGLKQIIGVEIFEPYFWQTKFLILEYFLENESQPQATIDLYRDDFFIFDFKKIGEIQDDDSGMLILGNPPWITNAELGRYKSANLPRKQNFKLQKGIEALTGASNFDLGEAVILSLFEKFAKRTGHLAMLVKDSVIKNLVHNLPQTYYKIDQIRAHKIDAKKYFNANVNASLLTCRLNAKKKAFICEIDALNRRGNEPGSFGWIGEKFVADVALYRRNAHFDGVSPLVWRQGVKHDCARIMELTQNNNAFFNGLNQPVCIESEPVFGLVKSSHLGELIVRAPRKFIILTQSRLGEETTGLAILHPKLYQYLMDHADWFTRRKSKVYADMPQFSIFGIGEYTLKPYKVAISGLYKRSGFSLLLPYEQKPLILDDTCYYLGFDNFFDAAFTWGILNGEAVQNLLASLTFLEAKRPYTKRLLMRIALDAVVEKLTFQQGHELVRCLDYSIAEKLTASDWNKFKTFMHKPSTMELPF